jgi:CDP-glycerol glycerophosphotransferase (TagB/SpsB family)
MSTSVKIIPYLKTNLFIKKNKYFDLLKLNIKKKTVLFCPTHDAFYNNRFFPSRFGSQFDKLINLADLVVNKLNLNFIIKLHHYHYKYLDNKILNSLKTWENLYIFKSNKDFDSTESKNIFYYSDILITDTSGSGVIGAFLNKKIIFM